jgi:hypothetical protein
VELKNALETIHTGNDHLGDLAMRRRDSWLELKSRKASYRKHYQGSREAMAKIPESLGLKWDGKLDQSVVDHGKRSW